MVGSETQWLLQANFCCCNTLVFNLWHYRRSGASRLSPAHLFT
jgi:predicted nucleic acid-binding Zn finger protein